MKLISVFFFSLCTQICLAQSEAAQEVSVIEAKEIVGIWTGRLGVFAPTQKGDLTQGLNKTNRLPSNPPMTNYLVIDPYGNFSYSQYTNAKWKIADQYLIVTTEYGKEIRGFLSADSISHQYRLNFEGQLFIREKKFDLGPEVK
jgi:hypothetical protein